jgi:mercuric ion binding protein
MKTITIIIAILFSINSQAQSTIKTTTIAVKGNCEQCKERIENAADIKGVKLAVWDAKTKIATVTYSSDKVTILQIEKAIANKGYEAGNEKANEAAYQKLPDCCQYKKGECKKK